jgi:hypothetical protein
MISSDVKADTLEKYLRQLEQTLEDHAYRIYDGKTTITHAILNGHLIVMIHQRGCGQKAAYFQYNRLGRCECRSSLHTGIKALVFHCIFL